MAIEILNFYLPPTNLTWNAGDPVFWSQEVVRQFASPANVRLYSTAVSGGVSLVNLTGGQASLSLSGGPEVWVRIVHQGNIFEYLSAPLSTPVEYADVVELWLGLGTLIANNGCIQVRYSMMINGHLAYERF